MMTLPGETLATGAPNPCPDCGVKVEPKVMRSQAGYYIGTECGCGPYSRESRYYLTRIKAQEALDNGTYFRA
jgi:hypothetical protein